MANANRTIEKTIIGATVDAMLAAGYRIGVDNGGDGFEYIGTDRVQIMEHAFAADEAKIYVAESAAKKADFFGGVYFVLGNGIDVLSDYTVNLETLLTPIHKLVDAIENGTAVISLPDVR